MGMRPREAITADHLEAKEHNDTWRGESLILEILLDIRDSLTVNVEGEKDRIETSLAPVMEMLNKLGINIPKPK